MKIIRRMMFDGVPATFIVNQRGRVYQKDLGAKTEKLAPAITEYDPDPTWQVSPD